MQGLGQVVFRELVTDRLSDTASFVGDVCLSVPNADLRIFSEGLRIQGLMTALQLEAARVRVEVGGWQLVAESMHATINQARLGGVSLTGPEAIGWAEEVVVDLSSGTVQGEHLRLATTQLRLDAEFALLDGQMLWAEGLLLTSCDCPPETAGVHLAARAARIDLERTVAVVEGGVAYLAGIRWELDDPTEVSEESLAAIELPITISSDAAGRRGLVIGSPLRDVAPGLRYAWEIGTGDDVNPPDLRLRINAVEGDRNLQWTGASDRFSLVWSSAARFGQGWRLTAAQRFEGGEMTDPVRRSTLRLAWQRNLDPPWSLAPTTSVGLGVTAAYTAQEIGTAQVVGPSLAIDGSLGLSGWRWGAWRPDLNLAFEHSGYPEQGLSQTWWSVSPSVQGTVGPVQTRLSYLGRWVVGGSPFTSSVDRRVPEQRIDLSSSVGFELPRSWQADLSLTVRYNFNADPRRPGANIGWSAFDPSLVLRGPLADGELILDANARLGGWMDPRPERDGRVSASVRWVQQGLGWEGGLRGTWGLVGNRGLRELTVLGAVPIRWDEGRWLLRPYLAVDTYTFFGGYGPWLRGYGLDLGWTTCCGRIETGYRYDEVTGAGATFAFILETYPLVPERLRAGE